MLVPLEPAREIRDAAQALPAAAPKDAQQHSEMAHATPHEEQASYLPLVTIVALILLATLAAALADLRAGTFHWHEVMTNFMAGFFIVFAGFKLLDLPGFAQGYSTYDLLAKRLPAYGYVYPFIELALGLAYLSGIAPTLTNWLTLVVMGFSSLGVIKSLSEKRAIQCACLGTVIKLPLTKVTLWEDLAMAVMAAAMLLS